MIYFIVLNNSEVEGRMAEWLRREIRNLMGSSRIGSNPVSVEFFFLNCENLSDR